MIFRMSISGGPVIMLEIKDLHSFYGDAHVLHGASLTVRDSEVVALLGRNGMGKTSLISSIMGLAAPAGSSGDDHLERRAPDQPQAT